MSLSTPEKIQKLQRGLYLKAKREPTFRFYALYDKIYRPDILEHAWRLSRAKHGAPGVDEVTFEQIEAEGVKGWLGKLGKELREKSYRPQAVRRVMLPKPGGGERPLGIPTIRDRVAERAAMFVLAPIFDADMEDSAHGYRPKHSAHGALKEVHDGLTQGYCDVVDADLSKYFDTIPHKDLMEALERRICDSDMLHLIKMWLGAAVEEKDDRGQWRRTSGTGKRHEGVPQGGVISPLLANVYMNKYLSSLRTENKLKEYCARVVNYADDFVILSKKRAQEALDWTRQRMAELGLKINEEKTRVVKAPATSFDFLGYTFGTITFPKDGHRYIGATPSRKSMDRLKVKIRELLKPSKKEPEAQIIARLNRVLRGWQNYFSYGTKWRAYSIVNEHARTMVLSFLRRRHKLQSRGSRQYPTRVLYGKVGLYQVGIRCNGRTSARAFG